MSKDKITFINNFKKYSKMYKDNLNKLGHLEEKNRAIAHYTLIEMTTYSIKKIFNDEKLLLSNIHKLAYDKQSTEELYKSLNAAIEEIKPEQGTHSKNYSKLKKIYENAIKDSTSIKDTFNFISHLNERSLDHDELKPFYNSLLYSINNRLNAIISVKDLDFTQQLIEENQNLLTDIPDEKEYQSYLEHPELMEHPLENDLNNLKGKDSELDKLIPEINDFMQSCDNQSNHIGIEAEKAGKVSIKMFKQGYDKFLKDNNLKNTEPLTKPKMTTEEVLDIYNKNNSGKIIFSNKFKDTIINSIDKYKKIEVDNMTFLSGVIEKDTKNLENAIKNKNVENIKKYYAQSKEKEKVIDEIISDLKQIDSENHYFNDNQASSRESYYPAKYRLDFEGTTLFNQMLTINYLCKQQKIDAKELFENPVKYIKNYFTDFETSKDNPYKKLFNNENIFECFNDYIDNVDMAQVKAEMHPNSIAQIANGLSLNNPENREETFHKLSTETFNVYTLYLKNSGIIHDALQDNEIISNQVIPGLLICKNDFDPLKMLNTEKNLYDSVNGIVRDPFYMSEYINTHDIVEICNNIKEQSKLLEERYSKNRNYDLFKAGIKASKEAVVNALLDLNTGCNKKEIIDYVECKTSNRKTSIANRTTIDKVEFYKNIKDGIDNTSIKKSIQNIADLKKKYDSHNSLAQTFFPSLRKQKQMILEMKNHLVNNGVDRIKLDQAIDKINRGEENTINYSNMINQEIELPKQEVGPTGRKQITLDNQLFDQEINKVNDTNIKDQPSIEKDKTIEENTLSKE